MFEKYIFDLFKDLLKDGSISLKIYIEKTVAFYDLYRKQPKL